MSGQPIQLICWHTNMFSRETLNDYIERGLITGQVHPVSSDVVIYNYTQKTQYEGLWDEVTTRCRGLIIDWRGEQSVLLSNPFPKFFNWEEHVQKGLAIPDGKPLVYEKLDGWLGILYWLDGLPYIATRGSFMSVGAQWATEWFRKHVDWENIEDRDWTHLFEIICPETKIVCNYDWQGIVRLTSRHLRHLDVDTAVSPQYNAPILYFKEKPVDYGCQCPKLRDLPLRDSGDYEFLRSLAKPNEEGFVIAFENGLRLKIKFDEYKRLHKIITGVSAIGIWEMMKDGQPINFENVPDEFFKWVEETQNKIRQDFHTIFEAASNAHSKTKNLPTRKEQALWLENNAKDVMSIAFALLDGQTQRAVSQVYKMIRPHGQHVYKKDD